MNPWVSGLVMAAILAAVLSTASPIFLSCGTLITRDIYCVYRKESTNEKNYYGFQELLRFALGFAVLFLPSCSVQQQRFLILFILLIAYGEVCL